MGGVGGGLYATDLYLQSSALYVNMGQKAIYKLDIIQDMAGNTFEDLTVNERSLNDFLCLRV